MPGTAMGEVWLIADFDVLNEEPDIADSGLPIFTLAEFATLAGKGVAGRRVAAVVKRGWPTVTVVDGPNPLPPTARRIPKPLSAWLATRPAVVMGEDDGLQWRSRREKER